MKINVFYILDKPVMEEVHEEINEEKNEAKAVINNDAGQIILDLFYLLLKSYF